MQKKLAIALSGGGARAMCYLGVIRSFQENDITIDLIEAHSGAALLLCYMATGKSDKEIIHAFAQYRQFRFLSLNPFTNRGFCSIAKMEKYYRNITKGKKIEELPWKTIISIADVTDYDQPKPVFIETGDLAKYSVMSSCLPPVTPLYRENGKMYADGAYCSLYGVEPLKKAGAEIVIGMYPDALQYTKMPGIAHDFSRVIKALLSAREAYERRENPIDLEIRGFPIHAGLNDYKKAQELFDAGYKKGIEMLPEVKNLVFD